MANNPYVNKVELADGTTLIDLTSDTVETGKMLSGYTAHDASGATVTGNIPTKTASNVAMDGITLKAAAGYYAENVEKDIASLTVPGDKALTVSYTSRETEEQTGNGIYVRENRKLSIQNTGGIIVVSHTTQGQGNLAVNAQGDEYSRNIVSNGTWATTNVSQAGTFFGKVVVPSVASWMFPIGALWATKDSTKNPATELGFGTWAKISPVQPTWGRLAETSTWASVQIDEPTVYVWERTA